LFFLKKKFFSPVAAPPLRPPLRPPLHHPKIHVFLMNEEQVREEWEPRERKNKKEKKKFQIESGSVSLQTYRSCQSCACRSTASSCTINAHTLDQPSSGPDCLVGDQIMSV
jgi:hypothetical protein